MDAFTCPIVVFYGRVVGRSRFFSFVFRSEGENEISWEKFLALVRRLHRADGNIFGYSLYASRLTEQQVLNQPLTTAHLVLSLGNNESTTLSMAVPGGYVAGFDVGAGTIFPTSSLGRETPNVGFYSEVASQDSLNRSAQQTILDTETQIHYADADQLTVNTATGTFLGYPAWIMTSKSDRPAETIVFQPASSTNMIEIRIIYSPSDPASENQVVDGILNSITISTSIGTSSTRETVAATSSMPVIINQSKKGSITTQPSISILSPSGGETWQLGRRKRFDGVPLE